MENIYSGGCACGAIRYEINGKPLVGVECQCRDCTHESGTGHGSHLVFMGAGVKLSGNASRWEMKADSGNLKTSGFCPTCGSPVYMTFAGKPEIFSVRAGSLDDPTLYRPQLITYRKRGYAWDKIDTTLTAFETMPSA